MYRGLERASRPVQRRRVEWTLLSRKLVTSQGSGPRIVTVGMRVVSGMQRRGIVGRQGSVRAGRNVSRGYLLI